jgi:signal transduction histidine kinase/ligand-binding sensor domain-containing protein/DNA-binding response OmpR family regulator
LSVQLIKPWRIFFLLLSLSRSCKTIQLFFVSFFALLPTVYADGVPVISKLGLKDGLSNSEVRCIYQDSKGYMWFGTYDGLNRYDGYDFKIYRNRPGDSRSIIHNYVNTIAEDKDHRLWIGTRQGISILDPVSQHFTQISMPKADKKMPHPIGTYIANITKDSAGDMFVGSEDQGLILFKAQNYHKGVQIPFKDQTGVHFGYRVITTASSKSGVLYLSIEGEGLCFYDRKNSCVRSIDRSIKTGVGLFVDDQNIWVGTSFGLQHYDLKARRYDHLYSEESGELRSNRITQIMPMTNNEVWIGSDGGGIDILNRSNGSFTHLSAGFDSHSLSSNAVHAMLVDSDSRKWIGTLRGGINVIDNLKDRFFTIAHDPTKPNSLVNSFVKSVLEDSRGLIWIGTDGGGLSIWNRKTNYFKNFQHTKRASTSLSSNFITSIVQDYTGKIWLTSYGGGINLYQDAKANFKAYMGLKPKGETASKVFWLFHEDLSRNLWVSGLHNGLFRYDRENDQFLLFDPSLKNILAFCEDSYGILWGGTFDGLYDIDTKNKNHKFFSIGKPIRAIHEDSGKKLWLGTEAGLMQFDRSSHQVVKRFTTDNGICNNNILNIEEDASGHLWLSTYNGLSRFDLKSQTFTNFFSSDGLQNTEFGFNASTVLKNGELAFGGINGLTIFNPQKIVPINKTPSLMITDLKVSNISVSERPHYITSRSSDHINTLTIPFNDAAVTINFSAIEFSSQERINYRYILEGWDRNWNNSGLIRNAVYTKLNPGTYHFKVNSTNAEGKWAKTSATLTIVVLPPWYATWWAYAFYILIIGSAVYWYLSYRWRETKLKYEINLARVNADNQKALQEKEREINDKRVEFFTGVAHEFRTPLTLIINPAKDLLSSEPRKDQNDINIIYRNARRLLSLVDQLLLFRKADAGVTQMNIGPMPIAHVCKEVFLCFAQQAASSGLEFTFKCQNEDLLIYGDREKIEIILYNLISNAIKYASTGKWVDVIVEELPQAVSVKVQDNGPGIPLEIGDRIFEKFYRSKTQGQSTKTGFGIGLHLAKQFANDHGGMLSYESIPGQLTTFTLTLRKGFDHYSLEQVLSVNSNKSSELLIELTEELQQPILTNKETVDFNVEKMFTDKQAVLVIDDDAEIRNYIISILEPNYVIYNAADGDKGLETAKLKLPDLIVCDIMMPGLNGIELCRIIKQDPLLNFIPMILLTASSSPQSRIDGLESGADDYISKPFDNDILLARVANLLQNRKNLQSYFFNAITLKSTTIPISEEYKQFLEKCISIVEQHLTDENFNINILAAELGVSRSNLFRKVKSLSGHSINSFIRYIRLRKAAELLIQSDLNVNQVAFETGFNDLKYFRVQFFKLFNANPSDFMRQKRPVFKKRFNVSDK